MTQRASHRLGLRWLRKNGHPKFVKRSQDCRTNEARFPREWRCARRFAREASRRSGVARRHELRGMPAPRRGAALSPPTEGPQGAGLGPRGLGRGCLEVKAPPTVSPGRAMPPTRLLPTGAETGVHTEPRTGSAPDVLRPGNAEMNRATCGDHLVGPSQRDVSSH